MRPAFGGTAELLQLDLAGHRLGVVLERSGPRSAPLWLLLPALSVRLLGNITFRFITRDLSPQLLGITVPMMIDVHSI